MDDGSTADARWALTDHLGSVRDLAVYDDQGTSTLADDAVTVVKHVAYDAFGNVTSTYSPTGVTNLFLFTARPFDAATGLQNNLHRWYDAAVGRWMSEDPVGFAGDTGNLYRYCGNEATGLIDPEGLDDGKPTTVTPSVKYSSSGTVTFESKIDAVMADWLRFKASIKEDSKGGTVITGGAEVGRPGDGTVWTPSFKWDRFGTVTFSTKASNALNDWLTTSIMVDTAEGGSVTGGVEIRPPDSDFVVTPSVKVGSGFTVFKIAASDKLTDRLKFTTSETFDTKKGHEVSGGLEILPPPLPPFPTRPILVSPVIGVGVNSGFDETSLIITVEWKR